MVFTRLDVAEEATCTWALLMMRMRTSFSTRWIGSGYNMKRECKPLCLFVLILDFLIFTVLSAIQPVAVELPISPGCTVRPTKSIPIRVACTSPWAAVEQATSGLVLAHATQIAQAVIAAFPKTDMVLPSCGVRCPVHTPARVRPAPARSLEEG